MPAVVPPSTSFDWDKLAFNLYPTNGYVSYTWKDGNWSAPEWITEPYLKLHIASVGLNYGASVFEGLKAFRHPDGQVRVFRPKDNAKRFNHSAAVVSMPDVPEDLFLEGIEIAVGRNLEFVPPHAPNGLSGSMYVRPLLFGSGPSLIPMPGQEYQFIVYTTPTGTLYGAGAAQGASAPPGVDAQVLTAFDRTAPRGVGNAKLAGNYAPVFRHTAAAKKAGFGITLHLDSATRSFIDEFSTANFLGIKDRDGKVTLVVPTSPSILGSITTKAIVDIAEGLGWAVERRPLPFAEVVEGGLDEVAAAGTAAAVTAVRSISFENEAGEVQKVKVGNGETAGPRFLQILQELTAIQSGIQAAPNSDWVWPEAGVDSERKL